MPKLRFPQPEFTTHSCDLPEGTTRVGRGSRNNLVLSDPSVSADHCELVVSWNEVIVRDHGSSNGTWVAGVRVKGQLPANHGDVIRFGRVEARLELDGLGEDEATSVTANFGAARAAELGSEAESFRKVIASGSSAEDTRNATISIPAPAKTEPVTGAPQPSQSKPTPPGKVPERWWWRVALAGAVLVAAAWLFRMLR